MNNQDDVSYLSSEDLEMLLLGTLAFWGDGSLNQEELDLLNQSCKKRIENLGIVSFSDSSDQDLSIKEYIIALFKMIEKISSDTKIYEDTELHKDFIKKKGKDYQPDDQLKFFSMLINELNASYKDDLAEIEVSEIPKEHKEGDSAGIRFTKLKNEIGKIAKIDKITDLERDMISLLELYAEKSGSKGCLLMMFLIGIAIWWYFFK